MQYATGIDLEDRIVEQEQLSIEEAASIGVQIASVLGSVHARDVVHRDLKGRNVIIRTDGVAKVLDFGVAAFLEPGTARLTTTGERPGSLECMAPEQILGKPVDQRTDLYSLGCLLLTGVRRDLLFGCTAVFLPGAPPRTGRVDRSSPSVSSEPHGTSGTGSASAGPEPAEPRETPRPRATARAPASQAAAAAAIRGGSIDGPPHPPPL